MIGQVAFITGAARGIGAETARRLAGAGMSVALVGLEPEELERVATQIGARAMWVEADVTDPESLARAVEQVVERFGGIDVVMANAGVAGSGPVRLQDPGSWRKTIDVNLVGVYETIRACLEPVIERKGYVLIVSSAAAIVHGPLMSAYCASKAGVEALGNSLRVELKPLGVQVGVLHPSWIDTDMVRGADATKTAGTMRSKLPGPFGKTTTLEDLGAAVLAGVRARKRRIFVPRDVYPLFLLRAAVPLLVERTQAKAAAEAEASFRAEIAEQGVVGASALVGAGGRAADRMTSAA